MKDILKFKKCPVSGLHINTKPEWKYAAKDGSCTLEIAIIGDDILYDVPTGIVNGEANEWYVKTANKIIADYFGNRKYYLAYDYSSLKNASLESKKVFINWLLSNSDKIELVTIFGMNQILKVAIKTGSYISKKYDKLLLTNSYQESINAILQKQNKSADSIGTVMKVDSNLTSDKQAEEIRINELIGYLGKMTWTGNLDQKIPVLPNDDPFAELFAAVAANQEDLREIEKDRNEAHKNLEKLISEKDEALKLVADSELVMLSMLEDVQMQETETKTTNEQLETIIKGANLGWWDWDISSGDAIFNEILTENLGYKLSEIVPSINWWDSQAHPDDEKQVYDDLQKHFNGETEYYENKHRLKTKSGKWKWFLDFGKVVERDKAGKAIRMTGTLRNIDKEERAGQTLRESEHKFKGLFTGMSLGVIFCEAIYDENNNMVDCIFRDMNSAYEKFTNLNKETAIGCKTSEMLPGTEHRWFSAFGEVVRTGKPISFEMYNAPTKKHYLVFAYRPQKDNFTAIFEDVTERKINEKELKHREAYLDALNKISEISFDSVSLAELQNFVEIIGAVANASRTYIFKNHRNQNNELLLSQVAEYVAEGVKPEIDNPDLQNLHYNDWLPRWEKLLKNGEIVSGKVAGFPEKERYLLEPQEIISLIVIPIFIEETFWGFLGFDNCVDNNEWNDNDIKYLKIATKRLEHSIELVGKQKLLEAENKRFKITMDAMNSGVYVADMQNYELLFLNKFFTDLIGEKAGEKCYKALQGLDEPCSFCTNKRLLNENQKPNQAYIWEFQNRITKRWYQLRDQAIRWMDGRIVRMEVAVDITEQREANKQITKLSAAVEQTANTIVITDTEGNIEYTNPQFTKITGYTAEEAMGENPRILNAGTQPKEYYAKMWKTIKTGETWRGEFHNKSKTGKLFWEAVTITPIKENYEIINFLAIKQDVTKQRESDKQIRKFSQVVETTSQSVVITNLEGNIVFVNEALIKTAGFDNESEIIGKSFYAFTDKQGVTKLKQEILPKIFNKDSFYDDEINIRKKDNTFYPAEIKGSFIKDETGKPELLVAMFSDITERKQAEAELKAKQNLNELLLSSMPYPIMLINRKRIVKAANKIAFDAGVKIGDYCWKEFGKCENLSDENLMWAKNNPDKPGIQCTFCLMDEIYKTNKLGNNPAVDAFGRIWDTYWLPLNDDEYLHYSIDITESKQAEKELIAAKEKAEESNRLKTAFLNNMSHEIRTPLNGITGFLGLLQDPDIETEDKQQYFDIINKSSDRLITTVTDILEISKIEAGLIEVFVKEVSVNKMLNDLYVFFSLEANNKGLNLIQLPSLSDDESVVLTDNHKLNGILTNLVKNAIKFTDKGSVTFGYNIATDFESGTLIQFFVKDTGIGIPKDRQQAIFNRFEQADIEDTRVFEGSGLGLAIAKSYVEMLGGKIWLKTEEGIGSEFIFSIPYKTKTGLINNEAEQKNPKNKQGGLKALTVLIAEDEEVNKHYFRVVFKSIFRQVIYVETGQQAIDACKNNPEIDLILMDIKMPRMSGYTATREIRKFNKEIIIIAQTAYGLAGDREKAIEAGCNDYIAKPINRNELFEIIRKYFLY